MKLKKLEANVLFVKDIKESVKFYTEVLGLEKTEESEGFANIKIGDSNIALVGSKIVKELLGKEITKPQFSSLLAIEVDDLDRTYNELKNEDVKVLKEPKLQSWGQYTAYFQDPDGHVLELFTWKK